MTAAVMIIAASDSGCGAGIAADIFTARDFGVFPVTAETGVTCQTSEGCFGVSPVPAEFVLETIQRLDGDFSPAAVKIGLIPDRQILDAVIEGIEGIRKKHPVFVVADPVSSASAGGIMSGLVKDDYLRLFSACDLVTPNVPELEMLTGARISCPDDLRNAAVSLASGLGGTSVLAKGGHIRGEYVFDFLLTSGYSAWFGEPYFDHCNKHGTGCTLSSAIASAMADNYDLNDAAALAEAYVTGGLSDALQIGHGPGPVRHDGLSQAFGCLPFINEETPSVRRYPEFPRCPARLGLYPVMPDLEWLERVLRAGVKTAQLRIKDRNDPCLFEKIQKAAELGKKYDACVFIDDHWEMAIEAGAYGVHLGQEDLLTADLGRISKAGLRLGVSTHGWYELSKAIALRPSYIALGHIFDTKTKKMKSKTQGIDRLRLFAGAVGDIPTVAIGGLSGRRFYDAVNTGVGSVACVTAITESPDPEQQIREYMSAFEISREGSQVK